MTNVTLKVEGMTCEHCQRHVTEALESVPGVAEAKVALEAGEANVTYDPAQADLSAMARAVAEAGYRLITR